jgi:hypothetical protein
VSKIKIKFSKLENWRKSFSLPIFFFLLTMPYSTSYKLKDYGFGSGGVANGTSPNYSLEAITGELSGGRETSPSYNIGPGLIFTNQANVPSAPTFDNPSNYYNKLRLIINTSNNPSDTKFAIAISTDNFVTTNYVQNDDTIGAVLGSEDYQTNTAWGAGGFYVIGLSSGTTYKVKVKAMQGKFTETGYGPIATAATVSPTLSFGINTNTINFGSLNSGIVNSSPQDTVTLDTNSASGASIFVIGSNEGLFSATVNHKINAVSGSLTPSVEGYGAQGVSVTQTSGGPLTLVAPYDQVGTNTVGIVNQTTRNIFDSVGPITGGSGTFLLKAAISSITPSANDYKETITMTAAGRF